MGAVNFNTSNQGQALFVGEVFGYVVAWGFSPFWLGRDNSLANAGPALTGSNFENRQGIYVDNGIVGAASASPRPVVIPWAGKVYVLNGFAPGDLADNIVNVELVSSCDISKSYS